MQLITMSLELDTWMSKYTAFDIFGPIHTK